MIWKMMAGAALCWAGTTAATPPPQDQAAATLTVQRAAMDRLVDYDGVYVGRWQILRPDGTVGQEGTSVHRVGPFLGGAVKMMEGRNYAADGSMTFNGLIVMSFDPATGKYMLRIYANGRVIDTEAVMQPGGYHFDVPNLDAPGFLRIHITVTPTQWRERVELHVATRVTEQARLDWNRVGPSDWPLGRPNPTPLPPAR